MQKTYDFILNRKFLLGLLVVYLMAFAASLWHRYIHIDENWFAEQSFYLATEGVVRLKSLPGILGFDQQMFMYHKLMIYIGALIVKLFGWSIYNFKIFVLIVCGIFFLIFYRYFITFRDECPEKMFLLSSLMILLMPQMIAQAFTFRPEVLVMCCGFAAYFYLHAFLQKSFWWQAVLAGVFTGLAFFVTTNGLIFPVAGFVLLLIKRQWKGLLYFSVTTLLSSSLFCLDLWQPGHFQLFLDQMKNWPTRKLGESYLPGNLGSFLRLKIINLIDEQQRFFWSDRVMMVSALFFLSIVVAFNELRRKYSDLFIYLIALILSLNILGSHIAERYLVFYLPFMAMVIAIAMLKIKQKGHSVLKVVYILILALDLFFVGRSFVGTFRANTNEPAIHKAVLSHIPVSNDRIFAPWKFIFNGIGQYNIMAYHALEYYQDDQPKKLGQEEAIQLLASKYHVKYLILDHDLTRDDQEEYPWFRGGIHEGITSVKLIFKDDAYAVYQMNTLSR